MIQLYCPRDDSTLERVWDRDAWYCVHCGFEINYLEVHRKWGGLLRSLRVKRG